MVAADHDGNLVLDLQRGGSSLTLRRLDGRVARLHRAAGNGPEVLIRYDSFQPNKDLDQTRTRTIVGFAYWFPHPGGNATAALLFDYERVKFDGFPAVPANATQQRYTLHGLINF